jgi:uncharacterized membrane protein YeaQ/YmgE (transglycosylase-associated protein family)
MVLEDVAQMGPMLVLAGLTVGWAAEALRRAGGPGLLGDLLVALVGSLVGGSVVWASTSTPPGMVAMFGIGCGGAALMIIAQRALWTSRRFGV